MAIFENHRCGMTRGRKSIYTSELAEKICDRLANGESLNRICKDEDMPDRGTVRNWLIDNPDFFSKYTRAREAQADFLAEQIIEISDDDSGDFKKTSDGETVFDAQHVQRAKLRVDARKWFASKVAPKKWGERSAVELTGVNGGPIETVAISADVPAVEAQRLYTEAMRKMRGEE